MMCDFIRAEIRRRLRATHSIKIGITNSSIESNYETVGNISRNTGITMSHINVFVSGKMKNPSIEMIEKLFKYLDLKITSDWVPVITETKRTIVIPTDSRRYETPCKFDEYLKIGDICTKKAYPTAKKKERHVAVSCDRCKTVFFKSAKAIKKSRRNLCSKECLHPSRLIVKCGYCDETLSIIPSHKKQFNYCNNKCKFNHGSIIRMQKHSPVS